ncbi:enoyl-CoA hydratase-related protein [Bradyrhizobium sp. NP1]|uniref:enoyl-CoA hydratase/isomerase family protein n=1 Tax=Bradyrhizobium sp. NP1 TaxID=3049772 RepID=UPI0025A5FA8C|nr:enoyl-CoA hydratase-related protein [Bradyrhizobium sp. NP1]WJR75834.1 enoyl-CoA hydratase-related protein [Bradyrhizobium sp. NP1]
MITPDVLFERRGQVAQATLNRPDSLNAITLPMIVHFEGILDEVARDNALCALVIAGSSRTFSAGADLTALAVDQDGIPVSGPDSFPDRLMRFLCKLERCPVPVIAAVQGWALAGGLEIVLCCDLVIAGTSARFGDAHAKYGLLPSGGSSIRLPRRIGAMRARELMFTGDWVTATAMREAGLVTRVVDDSEVEAETTRLADTLAARSPLCLRRMKSLLTLGSQQGLQEGLAAEQREWAAHAASEDMREGLSAFREKRPPRFTGF